MNTAEEYMWIYDHPAFNEMGKTSGISIEFQPVMVSPEDDHVKDDHSLNTKLNWWVETFIYVWEPSEGDYINLHDWNLDCGGDTAEQAVHELYLLVKEHYGDYDETK